MIDTITKDQVLNAYNNAPDFVRTVFNDERTTQTVKELQARFRLHVDNSGILAKEVGYLLLGLTDPSKFASRLKSQNFPDQTVDAIVTEINQKIFVPLRETERRGAVGTVQPARPASAPAPSAAPQRPAPQVSQAAALPPRGNYAPPPQSPRYPNQDQNNVNAFVHRVPQGPLNTGRPSVSVITPPAPSAPAPTQAPRSTETPLGQVLRSVAPQANLPAAPRPAVAPGGVGMPTPRAPLTPPPPPAQNAGDPYREPIE